VLESTSEHKTMIRRRNLRVVPRKPTSAAGTNAAATNAAATDAAAARHDSIEDISRELAQIAIALHNVSQSLHHKSVAENSVSED
jgi:hypothetical protein